jgi:hypothetical protein
MTEPLTDAEARLALNEVERGRQRVIDQIGMPRWYCGASPPAGSSWES